MKEHDSKVGIRLPTQQRRMIEQCIRRGRFKNISQVIRAALQEFLSKEGGQTA